MNFGAQLYVTGHLMSVLIGGNILFINDTGSGWYGTSVKKRRLIFNWLMAVYGFSFYGLRKNIRIRLKAIISYNPAKYGFSTKLVYFSVIFGELEQFLSCSEHEKLRFLGVSIKTRISLA